MFPAKGFFLLMDSIEKEKNMGVKNKKNVDIF